MAGPGEAGPSGEAEAEAEAEAERALAAGGQAGRRQLRGQYHELNDLLRDRRHDLTGNAEQLEAAIRQANALNQRVEKAREQALDTQALHNLSELGVGIAKGLGGGAATRSPGDLVNALVAAFVGSTDPQAALADSPSAFDWAAFGAGATRYFAGGVGLSCMLGPLEDAKPKGKRVGGKRAPKAALGAEVNPDELKGAATDAEKQETDKNLDAMFEILRAHKSLPLPLLVLTKASLAQTIENIFTLSFLVNQGHATLFQGDEGHYITVSFVAKGQAPATAPAAAGGAGESAAAGAARAKASVKYRQLVTSFDQLDWEAMVEDVGDHATYVAHREHNFEEPEPEPAPEPAPEPSPEPASPRSAEPEALAATPADATGAVQLLEDGAEADANDNFCHVCRGTGDLVCCDECPRAFHMHCIAPRMTKAEEAADHWACRVCTGGGRPPASRKPKTKPGPKVEAEAKNRKAAKAKEGKGKVRPDREERHAMSKELRGAINALRRAAAKCDRRQNAVRKRVPAELEPLLTRVAEVAYDECPNGSTQGEVFDALMKIMEPFASEATLKKRLTAAEMEYVKPGTKKLSGAEAVAGEMGIVCGACTEAVLVWGPEVGYEEHVRLPSGELMSLPEFEKHAGRGAAGKWKQSIRVRGPHGQSGVTLGEWLQAQGEGFAARHFSGKKKKHRTKAESPPSDKPQAQTGGAGSAAAFLEKVGGPRSVKAKVPKPRTANQGVTAEPSNSKGKEKAKANGAGPAGKQKSPAAVIDLTAHMPLSLRRRQSAGTKRPAAEVINLVDAHTPLSARKKRAQAAKGKGKGKAPVIQLF